MATVSTTTLPLGYDATACAGQSYRAPFSLMTVLFFMWGFMTVWNDLLIPRFKDAFTLSYFEAMLVQFAFFGAYFVGSLLYYLFSVFYGDPINRIGYKNGVILGLVIAGVGSALFYPAAQLLSYPFFLTALFVVGLGFAMLQITANPYVTILGPENTASSRLNLAQAFNSLGTTVGPIVGGWLIFKVFNSAGAHGTEAIKVPYLVVAAVFFALAFFFKFANLPAFSTKEVQRSGSLGPLKHPHTVLGMLAIFMYVGGEVSVGSVLISFLSSPEQGGLSYETASPYLALFWGGLMIGRFMGAFALSEMQSSKKLAFLVAIPLLALLLIGAISGWNNAQGYAVPVALLLSAFLLGKSKPNRMLVIFGGINVLLLLIVMTSRGAVAQWAVLGMGLFCSVMWSNIFSLAIDGLGAEKSQASSLLVMAILGGALLPPVQGLIADSVGIHASFIIPLVAFAYIVFYGLYGYRAGRNRQATPAQA